MKKNQLLRNIFITAIALILSTVLSFFFFKVTGNTNNTSLIHVLSIVLIARYTSGYAAPEVYKGKPASILSDIYSFGALLYFVSYGKHPENAMERAEKPRRT